MKNICFISTIAWPLKVYMGPHIRKVTNFNSVTLVADRASVLEMSVFGCSVSYKNIKILRRINLLLDIKALFELWMFFKANHFNCVHSIMPKAGLLSMAAAAAAGIPLRIHTFTGQIWVTRTGFSKQLLMFMDRLIVMFSTHILTDSLLQREFLIANKIVKPAKIHVLGAGSIAGINTNRFLPDAEVRLKVRRELGIEHDAIVFLFVGRLNKDKGILDLLKAYEQIYLTFPNSYLILVGPDEGNFDECILKTKDIFKNRIHREGFTECPEQFMAAADILCLPSYREGFNNVVLEAAATCLPTVGSRINGIVDSIVEGVTGILHEPGNVQELVLAMTTLAENDSLRLKMGVAAREHVIKHFSEVRITNAFEMFYRRLGVI
jgi:glycosyltransferase involved in cell wall biosynthesis